MAKAFMGHIMVVYAAAQQGLPLHDVIAYIAGAVALASAITGVVTTAYIMRKQRQITHMYRELIAYVRESSSRTPGHQQSTGNPNSTTGN